ncbi:MAG TPA: Fe-S cluster assembly protein SufD [Vicinamibacteria bacterium]|nr:Fe-S cluster assembly protein SufD [Vicinamibacteria bacterium]
MDGAVVEDKQTLRAAFERFVAARAAGEPAWLRERRTAGFAAFARKGLPGPRDEGWRHTPTADLTRTRFEPADSLAEAEETSLALVPHEPRGPEIVFVNGRFAPALSRLSPAQGVEVLSLSQALRSRPAALQPHLGRVLAEPAEAFADLNLAFAEDGAVVSVAPGAEVEEPVHVVHVSAPSPAASTLAYLHTLVLAGRGSDSRIVESFVGPPAGAYLLNAVTEVALEDGARVDHCKLQQEGGEGLHVATLAARLGRDARFVDHAVSLGAQLSRNDIQVLFDGEGGEVVLDGLFALDGQRTGDTHSRVDHARPHCTSRQLYKGIVDERGRGVFNGLVIVRPGAQKTDAVQTNRNLLLSRQALVHSTPQLSILADDVKCKHGSTTGQLDPTALFYLRSRGIGEPAARSLLTWAFAGDVLRGVSVPSVRRAAEHHLQAHLPGAAEVQEALS